MSDLFLFTQLQPSFYRSYHSIVPIVLIVPIVSIVPIVLIVSIVLIVPIVLIVLIVSIVLIVLSPLCYPPLLCYNKIFIIILIRGQDSNATHQFRVCVVFYNQQEFLVHILVNGLLQKFEGIRSTSWHQVHQQAAHSLL